MTGRRGLLLALPAAWLALFCVVPFAIVATISLAESVLAQPPYTPLLDWSGGGLPAWRGGLANYGLLVEDGLYVGALASALAMALAGTAGALLLGYPMAYVIAMARPGGRAVLLMLVILPFWTALLIRVYAWIAILANDGLLNRLLSALGLIEAPLALLYTPFAVWLGIVYGYLPFMVLPLYATLVRLDPDLLEAAADLGCRPLAAFLRVTLPLSMPGVLAGSLLVFIPAAGEFVIPDLLGGPDTLLIANLMWLEFFTNRDWPLASALAVTLLALLVGPILLLQRARGDGA
ncbi:MAG: ABC transporter permease subunit [Alphaproteobacteria bacterium]|nr:ABC transporter permease subunit [Alphaproteobacteria bacterium]